MLTNYIEIACENSLDLTGFGRLKTTSKLRELYL